MSNWKGRERQIAKAFGTLRNIGSGSQGRPDKSCSDTTHERLYIEIKSRKKHTAVTLWDDTKKKSIKEKKIPVVMLCENNRPGYWVLVHSSNLLEVAEEMCLTVELGEVSETKGVTDAGAIKEDGRENSYQDPIGRTH